VPVLPLAVNEIAAKPYALGSALLSAVM
jgi:hypothetical protein